MSILEYQKTLFDLVQKLDKEISEIKPSTGCYDSSHNDYSSIRFAVAEAYNKSVTYNAQKIKPYSYEIEPIDSVSLSDTIKCPFSTEHTQSCGCFGREYITIRMLSEQGITRYVSDKKKREDYIKLHKGKKLEVMLPILSQPLQDSVM